LIPLRDFKTADIFSLHALFRLKAERNSTQNAAIAAEDFRSPTKIYVTTIDVASPYFVFKKKTSFNIHAFTSRK